jgi:hypothetical protein
VTQVAEVAVNNASSHVMGLSLTAQGIFSKHVPNIMSNKKAMIGKVTGVTKYL